jgi:hypothetical protein
MGERLDPESAEYFAALGHCGLSVLAQDPFIEFTIAVDNGTNHGAGKEYVIHDRRAICIVGWGDGYACGLMCKEGDEEYPPDGFVCSEIVGIRFDLPSDCAPEGWYTERPGTIGRY